MSKRFYLTKKKASPNYKVWTHKPNFDKEMEKYYGKGCIKTMESDDLMGFLIPDKYKSIEGPWCLRLQLSLDVEPVFNLNNTV